MMMPILLRQVQEMLRRMEYCETLFPSTKQLEKEHPTWATPQYKARVKVGDGSLKVSDKCICVCGTSNVGQLFMVHGSWFN